MLYTEKSDKVVYNIDFDGTLTKGGYGENPAPNLKMITKVYELYMQGDIIIVWTARMWSQAGQVVVPWLIKHGVPFHGIMMGKGGSDVYVDDRAVTPEEFTKD